MGLAQLIAGAPGEPPPAPTTVQMYVAVGVVAIVTVGVVVVVEVGVKVAVELGGGVRTCVAVLVGVEVAVELGVDVRTGVPVPVAVYVGGWGAVGLFLFGQDEPMTPSAKINKTKDARYLFITTLLGVSNRISGHQGE